MKVVHSSPGLEDLWQLQLLHLSGQEVHGAPGMFIATRTAPINRPDMPIAPIPARNQGPGGPPAPVHNGVAHWIKVSARQTAPSR